MSTSTLTDTTLLSNFAYLRRPELLRLAIEPLAAPPAVLHELDQGEKLGKLPVCDWSWLETVMLSGEEQGIAAKLNTSLGQGEAGCLAVAKPRGWMVLTDDRDARRAAASLNVRTSGTLGVLVALVDKKHFTLADADAALAEMCKHGYRSPVTTLRGLV